MRQSIFTFVCTFVVGALFTGCIGGEGREAPAALGRAELHVDAGPRTVAFTRVTIEGADRSTDLVLNEDAGTYDGILILPSGMQSLVAKAFFDDTLIGQSQPVPVDVGAGVLTRVLIRILDIRPQDPGIYSPLFESLTFPTTVAAGSDATFAISVVAPGGDPVTYAWTSSCQDSVFSASQAPTTSWSNPTEGLCTISVVATSDGFSLSRSFVIVVLPGQTSGAADVSATFVTRPTLQFNLFDLGCSVSAGTNQTCARTIASPDVTSYQVNVSDWGTSPAGTIDLSDNCGGRFGTSFQFEDGRSGFWLPPVDGGICLLTARAVNGDGLATTFAPAVVVLPGTPRPGFPPSINAFLNGCSMRDAATPADCGTRAVGLFATVSGNLAWGGLPGTIEVTDECATAPIVAVGEFFFASWELVEDVGRTCTTTMRVTNLEGRTSVVAANYQLVGSP